MVISQSKAIFWFVFVGIIAFDLLNGFLIAAHIIPEGGIFSPSQLGRIFILGVMLFWVAKERITLAVYLVILLPFLVIEFLSGTIHQQPKGIAYGVISSLKLSVLFVPLIVSFSRLQSETVAHYFVTGLVAMSLVLFVSLVLGIGLPTYGSGGFGTKSYFASGNDIGMYLGASALIVMVARYYGIIQVSFIAVLCILLGLLSIASKTSLVFWLLCVVVLVSRTVLLRLGALLFIVAGIVFWEQVWSVVSVVLEIAIRRFESADGDWLFFITSGRNSYVVEAFASFNQEFSSLRTLFGRGVFVSFQSYQSVQQVDFLETDLFDIFFMFGVFGLAAYLSIWIGFVLRARRFVLFLLPVGMLFLHSAIAGHVVFSGFCLQTLLGLAAILSLADCQRIASTRIINRPLQEVPA